MIQCCVSQLKVHWRAIAVNVSNSVDNAEGAMQAPAPSAIHRNVIAQAADGRPVVRMFSSQCYEEAAFSKLMDNYDFHLQYYNTHLDDLSVELTEKADVVIVFVNDKVDRHILKKLADSGTKAVALRCAGFNNVDLEAAQDLGIRVVRVPQYSPNSVAEHTIALILALNRNIHRAYNRVRDRNFSLRGLVGFDLKGVILLFLWS
jgi:D-lactate dehydrogenase